MSQDERIRVEARTWTESRLQQSIIADILTLGVRRDLIYHTWNSRKSTPGFPDLIALHNGRGLAIELKSEGGKASDAQRAWLHAFGLLPGMRGDIWRPSDYLAGRCHEALLWLIGREAK